MADLADVEDALSQLVVSTLYPAGTDNESILGVFCRAYRGWPSPAALNVDLQAGIVNISVAPDSDMGRTTTRFKLSWHADRGPSTLIMEVVERTVVIGGLPTVGEVAGVLVDGESYVYAVRDGDTPDVVAAVLAAMVRSTQVVLLTGATLSIPSAVTVIARSVRFGNGFEEVRRQERDIRIISWCPTPSLRDTATAAIDQAVVRHDFLTLPDTTKARILYKGTSVYDQAQNSLLYRRDLIYTVEYPTTIVEVLPAMLFGHLSLNAAEFVA